MSAYIKSLFSKDISSFKKLTPQGQKLFFSILLYNIAAPIIFLFVEAFLWRETRDVQAVALYMLLNYAGLPIGFYINALLLKKYKLQKLYLLGNILRGLSVVFLIFFPVITYPVIFTFGLLSGITGGLHWANRNFMTLRMTESSNRIYFSSLDNSSNIITSIIIPILLGWFIIFGTKINAYTPLIAYQIISIIALALLYFSGMIIQKIHISIEPIQKIILFKTSSFWQQLRIFNITHGLFNGMLVLMPTIVTLFFLGKEDVLGTVQSYMALLSGIALYYLGKIMKVQQRLPILILSIVSAIIATSILGIIGSTLGIFLYLTLQAFSEPINEVCFESITYDAMDIEEKRNNIHHYRYIFDQEVFHNIGRVLGILFLMIFLHIQIQAIAIRFTPILLALSQLGLMMIMKNIEKRNSLAISFLPPVEEET